MPFPEKKTIELPFQGQADGTVEAFEVNGNLTIPSEEGVTYVSWEHVRDFFPQAREKEYPVPTHFLVLDQHENVRFSVPMDYKNRTLRETARQACVKWIQDAQDDANNCDSFVLRSAGVFSSRMESLASPESVGLSEQAVKAAASMLRNELSGLSQDRRTQLEQVINFLEGKPAPVLANIPNPPKGATHIQPNLNPSIASLFWRFEGNAWQYFYGNQWVDMGEGVTPPNLMPVFKGYDDHG